MNIFIRQQQGSLKYKYYEMERCELITTNDRSIEETVN